MPGKRKIYTIDDIARELGVSKTTVSRALSGKGRIGEETRKRVQQFAQTHECRADILARALGEPKSHNIGLLLPSLYIDVDFPFFRGCVKNVYEIASRENYDVMIAMVEEGKEDSRLKEQVLNRKVDGVIVTRSTIDKSIVNLLLEQEMPFVVIGPTDNEWVLSVDNSNREGCRELTSLLLMKGMRRLAMVGRSSSYGVTESNKRGYLDALRKFGMDVNEKLLILDVESQEQVNAAVEQAVRAGADGIICMDDLLALQTLKALEAHKIRVPTDMRLASCYDNEQLEKVYPPITSVHFDTEELVKNACWMLLDVIEGRSAKKKLPANYQVILRESTKV